MSISLQSTCDVIVSHLDNPGNFYVQFANSHAQLQFLSDQINQHYSSLTEMELSKITPKTIVLGNTFNTPACIFIYKYRLSQGQYLVQIVVCCVLPHITTVSSRVLSSHTPKGYEFVYDCVRRAKLATNPIDIIQNYRFRRTKLRSYAFSGVQFSPCIRSWSLPGPCSPLSLPSSVYSSS